MPSLPEIDFARIRDHEGTKHRAWEELSYLLAWDLDGLDAGTSMERRGTPDGGIEFSCIPTGKGNGGRWAWQAKYLFRFDASTFNQMEASFLAALDTTPDLERYTFVLPRDRSTAGLRKWATLVARWSKEASKRGKRKVEICFHGHSDMLKAIAQDHHAGAIRYFFDEAFLTADFFAGQVAREAANLGQRYDPSVNVETEARRIIDAACRGPRFVERITGLIRAPGERTPYIDRGNDEPVVANGLNAVDSLLGAWKPHALSAIEQLSSPGSGVFTDLTSAATVLSEGLNEQAGLVHARLDELDNQTRAAAVRKPAGKPRRRSNRPTKAEQEEAERESRRRTLWSFQSALAQVSGAVDDLLWHLRGDEVKAAVGGSVLLVGEAGCGKSHLVADAATERVAATLPSLLVLGQALTTGSIDPQIVNFIGLGSLPLTEVLQAVDVAARLRGEGRALLAIDAINEGAGAELWEQQLRGFIGLLAQYRWVALVITVRDVYEHAVAPDGVKGIIRSEHRGLAGHEEEALSRYADVYGLRLPDVPALLPEFTNPLFLRSLCQSVRGKGMTEIPRQAASLVWVFDGLIDAVDVALRRPGRLNYGDWERKVQAAVHAIAAAMVDADTEALPLADANDVCLQIHHETRYSHSLLNGLIVEGLLLRERTDRAGNPAETVRFTYQRLSDHLRAEVVLDRNAADRDLAMAVRMWSRSERPWAMSGVIEALVLQVPERRGKELATVLRLGTTVTTQRYGRQDPTTWLRAEAQEAFIDTLMWRSPESFTDATETLLYRYLRAGIVDEHRWLTILAGLACVPGHPLNVDWLDSRLFPMALAERDNRWSRQLLWVWSDDVNPITRTIDWAWSSSDSPEDVARLAGLFLSWLLTSPNRRLRDCATKALVSVTIRHPRLLADLVRHFAGINDLYVLDRVIAAAYGHVLRSRNDDPRTLDLDAITALGQAVYDAVFGDEIPAHLMTRHRARSCTHVIETILEANGRTLERNRARTDPPYGSPWPLTAPGIRALARGFGRERSKYLGAATELDWEFTEQIERHVVSGLAMPNQKRLRAARRRQLLRAYAQKLDALVLAAPPSRRDRVRRRAETLLADRVGDAETWTNVRQRFEAWNSFEASLSKVARQAAVELRRTADALDRVDTETIHPNPDLCIRWVAGRVLELGWTKDRFGDQDRRISRSADGQVSATVAQKYQRIAFQELAGHLADHCTIDEAWRGDPEPYRGPWQITETLDVDPSLLLRGDVPESETPAARLRDLRLRSEQEPTWFRTLGGHRLSMTGTDDGWLSDLTDIPDPMALLLATDSHGREWVAVERHREWDFEDPTDLSRGYRRPKRQLWFRSQANVIRADDTAHAAWAANTNWMGLSAVSTPGYDWTANLGEYPDIEPWPHLLDVGDTERRPQEPDDPGTDELPQGWEYASIDDETRAPYALATFGYHQESNRDLSAEDTPRATLPSRILRSVLGATWSAGRVIGPDLRLGPVEREYSWIADGEVVAFCTAGREYGSDRVLWVRADPLRAALLRAGLAMWAWVLGEKIYWTGQTPSSDRTDCFAAVRLAPGPATVWGSTIERDKGRERGAGGRRLRLWAERAAGIDETGGARRTRRR